MISSRPWLLWAAPLIVTMVLAIVLARVPTNAIAPLLGISIILGVLTLVIDLWPKPQSDRQYVARLGANLLVGSLLSGAFGLLFLVAFYPRPGITNLAWVAGIPTLVAFGQGPRTLALVVPTVVFGWVAFALIAWALQVPVD